jgi:hypothetical protein
VEGSALSETEKETAHGVRAVDVAALTTVGTFGCTNQRKMMVINLDRLAPCEGTAWDEWPQGEQRELLERSHCENRAMGGKVRPVTDVTCTPLGKRRNGGTPVGYLG